MVRRNKLLIHRTITRRSADKSAGTRTAGRRYETTKRVSARVYAGRALSVPVASRISPGCYVGIAIIQVPAYKGLSLVELFPWIRQWPIFDAQGIVPSRDIDI